MAINRHHQFVALSICFRISKRSRSVAQQGKRACAPGTGFNTLYTDI